MNKLLYKNRKQKFGEQKKKNQIHNNSVNGIIIIQLTLKSIN